MGVFATSGVFVALGIDVDLKPLTVEGEIV
jgi:hypothetical protein